MFWGEDSDCVLGHVELGGVCGTWQTGGTVGLRFRRVCLGAGSVSVS